GENHDPTAAEDLAGECRHLRPLAGAARVRRGVEAEGGEPVRVFLTLDDEDEVLGLGGDKIGKPVEHAARPVELPLPPAPPVRGPLAEGLGLEAEDLVEELAAFVLVVVGCSRLGVALADGVGGLSVLLRWEEVEERQPDRAYDRVELAAGVTGEEHLAISALSDAQRLS